MKSNYNFYDITEKDIELMSCVVRCSFIFSPEFCLVDVSRVYDSLVESFPFLDLTFYQDYLCRRAIIYLFKVCDCLCGCLSYIDKLFDELKLRGDFACK